MTFFDLFSKFPNVLVIAVFDLSLLIGCGGIAEELPAASASTTAGTAASGGGAPKSDSQVTASNSDVSDDLAEDDFNDPIEPVNRLVFGFNEVVYRLILDPVTIFYESLTPTPVQNALSNAFDNLKAPVTLANDLLQGEGHRAAETTNRFFINTVFGLGGLFDPAAKIGIEHHEEDFGQTLAVWGVPENFYLVLPILGPSNPSDAIGIYLVDPLADLPGRYLKNTKKDDVALGLTIFGAVDGYRQKRGELESVRATSIDYYASIRSLYRQKRKIDIANGAPTDLTDLPDMPTDFFDETANFPQDSQ